MKTDHFIRFSPLGDQACEAYKSDAELVAEGWMCPACRTPISTVEKIDLQINSARITPAPLSFEAVSLLGIAKLDFLMLFGRANVERDLMLGKVTGPDGTVIDGWVTWRSRHRTYVRGQLGIGYDGPRKVGYRYCPVCRALLTSAFGAPYYICPPLPSGECLIQGGVGPTLIVPERLAGHVTMKPTRGFGRTKLKVLEKAPDGFGSMDRGGPGDLTDEYAV